MTKLYVVLVYFSNSFNKLTMIFPENHQIKMYKIEEPVTGPNELNS